jgi:ABC-type branched-subunit amino acid transport system ATPase component
MKLVLPKKINSPVDIVFEDVKSIVVIGANGSGKTRFGSRIEESYNNQTHRVSAQKSLSMPTEVSPKSRERAELEFWYGTYNDNLNWLETAGKKNSRWGNNLNTYLLNDYDKLMVLLHTEEYETSIKLKEQYSPGMTTPKPITKLDRVHNIWEKVLPHRKLIKSAGKIETYPSNKPQDKYNAAEMSDGERVIFYLIGEIVCAKDNSIIIIDEPEMHIHKSITKKLWDLVEIERPDCVYIYLTHDIDFAISRTSAKRIWLKSYEGNQVWDYEIIDSQSNIPESVYLEILGSRNNILFIEGDNSSTDYKLYQHIFTTETIQALGSHVKVLEATKTFNELNGFHHLSARGLIDRDRRTDEEIRGLRSLNILVPEVAEIENIFLLEAIIKILSKRLFKEPDAVFANVKAGVIDQFKKDLVGQVSQHTLYQIKRRFTKEINPSAKDQAEITKAVKAFTSSLDSDKIFNEVKAQFEEFITKSDYLAILKVYNNKGLLFNSGLPQQLGVNGNEIPNLVIGILKEGTADSTKISEAIRQVVV